jgi:hypothetical protein
MEIRNGSSYKIIGLIGSVVLVLSIFIGATTWVSIRVANNTIGVSGNKESIQRHEKLIADNSEIIRQHGRILSIIDQHESSLEILTAFMTKGGRFTESDGHILEVKLQEVKDQLKHYEVLEAELGWIKESMRRLEINMARRFDSLQKKLEIRRGP